MSEAVRGRLKLPHDFDFELAMPATRTDEGTFHETRRAAGLAGDLIVNGHQDDLDLAQEVLNAVIACQVKDEADPHYGNYLWMREDEVVTDLNAAAFVCCAWLPSRILRGDRLPRRVLLGWDASIRIAIEALERLDVLLHYSNVAMMDITARVLAARALGDDELAQRGHDRLANWAASTWAQGHPFEFNSPTYTRLTFRTLLLLARHAKRQDTQRLARASAHRLGLSIALHLQPDSGRWAGPHSRAYRSSLETTGDDGERGRMALRAEGGPVWLSRVRPAPGDLIETASRETSQLLTTHHHPAFSLGSAVAAFADQANRVILHGRNGQGGNGQGDDVIAYSRFLRNDLRLEDVRHDTDRAKGTHLPDQGKSFTVQQGPRLIALYAPNGALRNCTSAATCICVAGGQAEARVTHHRAGVESRLLPGDQVPDEGIVAIEASGVRIALVLLTRTQLHPVCSVLERRGSDLCLVWSHYRGPRKTFWETEWPGPYYQGPPLCGFYLEAAAQDEHGSVADFAAQVAGTALRVDYESPVSYSGTESRDWCAHASRDDFSLALQVDTLSWGLLSRRGRDEAELPWPAIESPQVESGTSGRLAKNGATYTGPAGPAWVFGDRDLQLWAAGHMGERAGKIELVVPAGSVRAKANGPAILVWDRGEVEVDGVEASHVKVERRGQAV